MLLLEKGGIAGMQHNSAEYLHLFTECVGLQSVTARQAGYGNNRQHSQQHQHQDQRGEKNMKSHHPPQKNLKEPPTCAQ